MSARSYAIVRDSLILGARRAHPATISAKPSETSRVCAALCASAFKLNPREAVVSERKILRAAMNRLGIPRALRPRIAAIFYPLLMELLKVLLPILIQWIKQQLEDIDIDKLFSGETELERQLRQIGMDAEESL